MALNPQDENRADTLPTEEQPGMGGFFGTYTHSIDAKNRMIIPQALREELGERFTIGPTLDFQGIALYPLSEWLNLLARLRRMMAAKPSAQRVVDQVAKYSFPGSECDMQGRVLLPQKLRERMLGDNRDVEISGALTHIRVMPAIKAAEVDRQFTDDIPDVQAYMDEAMSCIACIEKPLAP